MVGEDPTGADGRVETFHLFLCRLDGDSAVEDLMTKRRAHRVNRDNARDAHASEVTMRAI